MAWQQSRRPSLLAGIATILLVVFLYGIWQAFHTGNPFTLPGSSQSAREQAGKGDMSVEEAGAFAGDRYRSARRNHLENRAQYLRLPFSPIPSTTAQVAESLKDPVRSELSRAGLSAREAEADRLCEALAAAIGRAAGLADEQYLASLPADALMAVPPNLTSAEMQGLYDVFLDDASRPDFENPDSDDVRRIFADLSAMTRNHHAGAVLARDWSLTDGGLVLLVDRVTPGDVNFDFLMDQIKPGDSLYWYGSLADAAFMFHLPTTSRKERAESEGSLLVAHAGLIVRSLSGDAYPILLRAWFDAPAGVWRVDGFSRRSSIQVGNAPLIIL